MKLITKEIQKQLDAAGYINEGGAICKLFNPYGNGTWVIFGRDEHDPDILTCMADLGMDCVELGSVRLSELQSLRKFGQPQIERDRHFSAAGKNPDYFYDYYNKHHTLNGC